MRIAAKLEKVRNEGRRALAIFSTIGDPDAPTSLEIFARLHEWGADVLELGVPYSDPLMDGPTLQVSYRRSLRNGFDINDAPMFVEKLRQRTEITALIMTCFNPVFRYGVNRFFRDVSNAGVDSVLITDLPPEEWGEYLELARGFDLGTVFLVTPTTTVKRMDLIAGLSDPFVYCVSRTGITGERDSLPEELRSYVRFVKDMIKKPVLIGFGISTPQQARLAGELADGVVIGSATVKIIENNLGSRAKMLIELEKFVTSVRDEMCR
ncbi:MAG: tryptophan synthase subunit alpha [bacterium]